MKTLLSTLLLLAAACSSKTTATPPPTSCNKTDRVGTYRFSFVTQSGNCGPIDSQLVSLNPGPMGAGTGCVLNSEVWSDGDCKLERDVSCSTKVGVVRVVAVTTQETANGSELAGAETFNVDGPNPCDGTYAIDAVRQ